MDFSQIKRMIVQTGYVGTMPQYGMATLESRSRRNSDLESLGNVLEKRQDELKQEIESANPNMRRVMALRSIISNLQGTLNSAKR